MSELLTEPEGVELRNYALIPYEPLADPSGRLRSLNLLHRSFDLVGVGARGRDLCEASAAEAGPSCTAYGVKWEGDRLAWELYYYFHADRRRLGFDRVDRVLERGGFAGVAVPTDPARSWYSVSLDLDEAVLSDRAPVEGLHVYVTHHPAEPPMSISYAVRGEGFRLENVYRLFHPRRDREAMDGQLGGSAITGSERFRAEQVLWPDLLGGDHVALAHKPDRDGVYFGRVDVDAFAGFLRRTRAPGDLLAFVEEHRDALAHLGFDVGFDYRLTGGRVEVVKAGFYGSF